MPRHTAKTSLITLILRRPFRHPLQEYQKINHQHDIMKGLQYPAMKLYRVHDERHGMCGSQQLQDAQ
jgi:hypothetical protein